MLRERTVVVESYCSEPARIQPCSPLFGVKFFLMLSHVAVSLITLSENSAADYL